MKQTQFRWIVMSLFLTSMFFSVLCQSSLGQENEDTYNVNFAPGSELLYKNEHYLLNESGERTLDRTKWSKITIDAVEQLPEQQSVKVVWSKWDVENVSLKEIDDNPNLWVKGFANMASIMKASDPLSRYQSVFNEQNASMSELTPDILLGKYKIFYTNEWNYYFNTINQTWNGAGNQLIENIIEPSIKDQQARILDANIHAHASIRLNATYPDEPTAYYNSTFDLKLYLVYGMETNILLSYNINFTIHEKIFDQADKIQRKIIFWNIRRPAELTEDYPTLEIIDIPAYPLEIIGIISIFSVITTLKLKAFKINSAQSKINARRFI